jgi:hypothetical protein
MKIKKLTFFLFIVLLFSNATAQEFELGKVSISELQEKVHPNDTSAIAAYLFQKGKTHFAYDGLTGWSIVYEYTCRIKIYKKEGLSWATNHAFARKGYKKLKDDELLFSKGVTYNLENGKIVKTKLASEGTFNIDYSEYWKEASITMPNVKVGSVIEYKYIQKSESILEFPVFNFQSTIPVNYGEYITETPTQLIYKTVRLGSHEIHSEDKEVSGNIAFLDEVHQPSSMELNKIVSKHWVKDVPALLEESYVDNIQNYKLSLHCELEKVMNDNRTDKNYSETWEGVAKTIFEDKRFGKELSERAIYAKDMQLLLKDVSLPVDRLGLVFKYVQNKMNWNGKRGYYTDQGVVLAYGNQTGNVAEINFILISMLKLAGIKADPVLVSSCENGISVFPSIAAFDRVIAAATIDGKKILLDASNKYSTIGILPTNLLNWKGRLIKEDGASEEVNLYPIQKSTAHCMMMVKVEPTGKLGGKVRLSNSDYKAYDFRVENAKIGKEDYQEKLQNQLNLLQISEYNVENKTGNLTKPVVETFAFESDNHCDVIGNSIYINPLLFYTLRNNPFVLENRTSPIYFAYPSEGKFVVSYIIPDGYVVESLPKPIKISTEHKLGMFSMNVLAEGNKINVILSSEINDAIFSADYYNEIKSFYQQIVDSETEKIVLKKV